MSKHTQLHLRIVGHNKLMSGSRNEALSDQLSAWCSDRDILKVWIRGRQAAGSGSSLIEGGMNPARFGARASRENVNVR